jgi:hypothetical protein
MTCMCFNVDILSVGRTILNCTVDIFVRTSFLVTLCWNHLLYSGCTQYMASIYPQRSATSTKGKQENQL